MNTVSLLPRLSAGAILQFQREYESDGLPDYRERIATYSKFSSFAATGGARDEHSAAEIRTKLMELARACGFPAIPNQKNAQKFDKDAAIFLSTHNALQSAEALRDDVWAYLAIVECAELVQWRFKNYTHDRYRGGVRNAFQRLWLRGKAVDRGEEHADRWEILESFPEDAASQLLDRTRLINDRDLTLAIGEVWLKYSQDEDLNVKLSEVLREACKILRMKTEIVLYSCYEFEGLIASVEDVFELAVAECRTR